MALTETLRQQHSAILLHVSVIQSASERGNRVQLQQELEKLGRALVAHLTTEDTHLYPEFERLAVENGSENLAVVARQFANSMSRITAALLAFLSKYEKSISNLAVFRQDWSHVAAALSSRISTEEGRLYSLYERALLESQNREAAQVG